MARSLAATRTLGLSAITAATLVIGGPVSARSFVDDVGAAVSTATGDAGRSVGTAWEQTKAAVHKGAGDTGDLLGKGLDGVNHAAKEVEKVFCDVMTAGKASPATYRSPRQVGRPAKQPRGGIRHNGRDLENGCQRRPAAPAPHKFRRQHVTAGRRGLFGRHTSLPNRVPVRQCERHRRQFRPIDAARG